MRLRWSTPNSSKAAPIFRFKSSHCTKQITLQVGSSRRNFCTCSTSASILEPYLAKTCKGSTATSSPGSTSCDSSRLCLNDFRAFKRVVDSPLRAMSWAAQFSTSTFHASTILRNFSAFPGSRSHCQFASSSSGSATPAAPGQRGMPKCDLNLTQRAGGEARVVAKTLRTAWSTNSSPVSGSFVTSGASDADAMSCCQAEAGRFGSFDALPAALRSKSGRRTMSRAAGEASAMAPPISPSDEPKSFAMSSAFVPTMDTPKKRSRAAIAERDSFKMKP
mmetsp:Transcript_37791/g.108683  ORF Transcript_37791/g.108683 Transcript_37791/m.108683 type:complete len:277 (-) Transcript_37791:2280-3110(-)